MTQTEFVTKIDSRGSINVPKALREAGYGIGVKVLVILRIVEEGPANEQVKEYQEEAT